MNVAFLYAGPHVSIHVAMAMVASVRKAMPEARIIQLTDLGSPSLHFVDAVRRRESRDIVDARFAHQEDLPGDTLVMDYDCILQRDVAKVFEQPFDLAFTRRPVVDRSASASAAKAMPHNLGVIFQRDGGRAFWREVRACWARLETDNWLAGQVLVSDAIEKLRGNYRIVELPGEYYNYTPQSEGEDVRARAIVHYKGGRKHWMVKDGRDDALRAGRHVVEMTDKASD